MSSHYFPCSTDYIRYFQHQPPSSPVFLGCLSTGNKKERLENVQKLNMACFKEQKQHSELFTTISGGQMSDDFFVKFLPVQTDITSIIKCKSSPIQNNSEQMQGLPILHARPFCGRNSTMERKVLTDAYLQPHATLE